MSHNDYKEGFGVVAAGGLDVRTVSDTRRAAIVNWLYTHGIIVFQTNTDEQIERMWELNCGDAMVRPVRLYVQ